MIRINKIKIIKKIKYNFSKTKTIKINLKHQLKILQIKK
jgi:hypothetical protein